MTVFRSGSVSLLALVAMMHFACGNSDGSSSPRPDGGSAASGAGASGAGGALVGGNGGTGNSSRGGTGNVVATGGLSGISGPMVGAWYGTGPDGDQCIVVCGSGKVFTGDRPCTDVTAADFNTYLAATASGTSLTVSGSAACWIASKACGASVALTWNINGNAAVVSWCGFDLHLNRTGDPPPVLCDDPNRGPC